MESNNRITFYITFLALLTLIFLPCAIAQTGGRGGRGGGDMMGGGTRGGDRGMPGGVGRGDRGGGRGGPSRGGMFFQNEELSESQIDRIMQEFTKQDPTKAKELEELRKTDKEKFLYELRANAFMIVAQEMREAREYREILEWCETFVSDEAKGIRELKDENYNLYKSRLDSLRNKYRTLIYSRGISDELMSTYVSDYQLDNTLRELSRQYVNRSTSEEEKASILEEIKDALGKKYDIRIQQREIQYKEIQKEIQRLQTMVAQQISEVERWKEEDIKENEINSQLKFYTEPRLPSRRGLFSRPMFPLIQDQNSAPDSE